MYPLLLAAGLASIIGLGIARSLRPEGLMGLWWVFSVLWFVSFWPDRVLMKAEAIFEKVALPRVEFPPGLIVRSPGDEATLALVSVVAFSTLARRIWSLIARARARFGGDEITSRQRSFGDWIEHIWGMIVCGLIVGGAIWGAYVASTEGHWVLLALLVLFVFPIVIVLGVFFVVSLGGAALMLPLLPVFSFLLWPFGIAPTIAASLLTVSAETSPPGRWTIVQLPLEPESFARIWKHSTQNRPDALEAIAEYLQTIRLGRSNPD